MNGSLRSEPRGCGAGLRLNLLEGVTILAMTMHGRTSDFTQQSGVPVLAAIQHSLSQAAQEAKIKAAQVRGALGDADARCRQVVATEPLKASVIAAVSGAVLTVIVLGLVRRARAKHRL